jgi:uncharacterized protein (TIGR02145 family)
MKQLVYLVIFTLNISAIGQTFIPGGIVNGTWNSINSPYLIQGDIYIIGGDTLFIEPGVEIIFENNYIFDVSGCLIAQGAQNDSIRFTEADTAGYSTGTDPGWSFNFNTDYNNFLNKYILLDHCIIEYGNGISAFEMAYSDLNISNSLIQNCKSYGLSVFGYTVVNLTNNKFLNNKGGGIYVWVTGSFEDVHITNCVFDHNTGNGITTSYGSGPVYIENSVITCNTESGILIAPDFPFFISDSRVEGNGNFNTDGGGIVANGNCTMDSVIVKNNRALNGGGMALQNTILNEVSVSNSRIENNISSQSGGGIYAYLADDIDIFSTIISDNTANNGGGVYLMQGSYEKNFLNVIISGNHAFSRGGGFYTYQNYDSIEFFRTTIVDNVADIEGSGLFSELSDFYFNSGIIWNNNPSNIVVSGGDCVFSYSDIEHGWPGTGNINAIPHFLDPLYQNYRLSWINYPVSDYTRSPCIDCGDPDISPDSDSTRADMGAHFFDHSSLIQKNLDITVLLEGAFFEGQMNTNLYTAGVLPEQQPYFAPPWNHFSSLTEDNILTNNIVDWVFVEIRKLCNFSNQDHYYSVSRQAAFLLNDGTIRDTNGSSLLQFYTSEDDSLFVSVFHRNHLPVISSSPLDLSANPVIYDFTSDELTVQGGDHAQKELSQGIWAMIAGDGNADGQINSIDKNEVWLAQNGSSGYFSGDYNMDGAVDAGDKSGIWDSNCGRGNLVSYLDVAPFQCGDVLFDARDGKQYNTVQIDTQCWMAENLDAGLQIESSASPLNNGIIEKYCYENLDYYCDIYGGLYLWDEMMMYTSDTINQGICPPNGGWRLPTDFDWKLLEGTVDSQYGVGDPEWDNLYKRGYDVGKNLKSDNGWYLNGNGIDLYNFTALPAGEFEYTSVFNYKNEYAAFFSASLESDAKAWGRVFGATYDKSFRGAYYKTYGFSIRCLRE